MPLSPTSSAPSGASGASRCVLESEVVKVFDVVPAGLNVLVNNVGRDGADFHKTVMLDENCVTRQIAMDDWIAFLMQIALGKKNKN